MRTALAILLTICFCVSGLLAGTEAEQSDVLVGRWEELPLFPSRRAAGPCIGIERRGTLWILAKNFVCYWDGEKLVEPDDLQLTPGYYVYGLHGGVDRKLYASRSNKQNNNNQLYELVDGQAVYVTDFYHDNSYDYPALYVSKSGLLFNWGTRFLAVYVQDQWKQIEAYLHPEYALTFDTGDKVHFYYNRNLYSVDKHGNFIKRQISAPIESIHGRKRIHGTIWGQDKMLIFDYGSKQVYAYYLVSGELVDTELIHSYLSGRPVYDVFSTNNGDVWLLIFDPELSYVFLRITPEVKITTVKETAQLGWDNTQFWQFPHSVLSASDGSIWLSSRQDGIVRYKNSRMQVFGWRQGVNFGRCRFLEDSQGQIYISSDNGVYVFRPGQPGQLLAWVHQWQEYRLASSLPIRDCVGNICMFLEDHPGQISRWDGYRWNHINVPFDTSNVGSLMADDKEHILLSIRGSLPWYDISPSEVNQYENFTDMLVAAVARGVKRFYPDSLYNVSIVVKDGKIWVGLLNSNIVSYFDGERWNNFTIRGDIDYLYESPKYGIMIRTEAGKYYILDDGQITYLEIPKHVPTRWLLGSKSLQPFEQEILNEHPNEYIPVERAENGKLYMLVSKKFNNTSSSLEISYLRADVIDDYIKTVTPGLWGGYWSDYFGGGVVRFFDGRALGCDFQSTPVAYIEKRQVLEDRAHNLWIDAGWYSGARHVFMKRLSDFKLTTEYIPAEAKRSLTINTEAQLSGQPQSNTRFFWRFKEEPWHGGEHTNSVTIYFPTDGFYQIEMFAMEPIGGITPKTSFGIHATVPLPDTIFTETGPYTCKDIIWQIPANALPSEPGQLPHLAYRIDEKEWQQAYKDKMISFQGLEPGEYHIQVAAVEDERFYDATPLALDVTFAPDYNLIVEKRLELIMGDDPNQAQAALAEIKMAGPDMVAVLQQKIDEARKVLQMIAEFERLIREIKRGPQDLEIRRHFEPSPPPPPPPPTIR